MIGGRSSTATAARRSEPATGQRRTETGARRRRRWPRPGPRSLMAVVAALIVAAGAWLWLRTSSLVAVRQVTVAGVSGPDAGQIRSALESAAHGMTTLDVRMNELRTAVAPYPVVKHLEVSTSFPHAMRIQVVEQVPVGEIAVGARQEAVSADGTLLHEAADTGPLPTIELSVSPGGAHLQGAGRTEARLLAAAPYRVLARVAQVSTDPAHGLVAALRNGPDIYFGAGTQLTAKWSAALAVLASSSSDGAAYVDVSDPSRPAAGAGSDAGSSASTTAAPSGTASPPSDSPSAATGAAASTVPSGG